MNKIGYIFSTSDTYTRTLFTVNHCTNLHHIFLS